MRILLVEDELDVRQVMEHVLIDDGYEVDSTATFDGASDFLGCRHYDLLVADGRLPDGTGMGLADRAHEKGIPALIVTGYGFSLFGQTDRTRYNVLLKPVRPAELTEAVAAALGLRAQNS